MMRRAVLFIVFGIVSILVWRWYHPPFVPVVTGIPTRPTPTVTPTLSPTPKPIPHSFLIPGGTHVFQTFNNCGPAALSMALSYLGMSKTQTELGLDLRPYQVPGGDNDDKSVTLKELADKATALGFVSYHRPGGTTELVKRFTAEGIPVITRTRLKKEDDIGHFRIIKGYDDAAGEFIQDDSLQGKNLRYSYADFSDLWQTFGYEYLIISRAEKTEEILAILGDQADETVAWRLAADSYRNVLKTNPSDMYTGLNLSVALYHIGDFTGSVSEFEKVESRLPFRTLWYQIEPMLSYYELKQDARVFDITDRILSNQNRAYSELYLIRGRAYQRQGNSDKAREEFAKAVLYNTSLAEAREALSSVQ